MKITMSPDKGSILYFNVQDVKGDSKTTNGTTVAVGSGEIYEPTECKFANALQQTRPVYLNSSKAHLQIPHQSQLPAVNLPSWDLLSLLRRLGHAKCQIGHGRMVFLHFSSHSKLSPKTPPFKSYYRIRTRVVPISVYHSLLDHRSKLSYTAEMGSLRACRRLLVLRIVVAQAVS